MGWKCPSQLKPTRSILLLPLLTEKMTKIADKTQQIGFIVDKVASKDEKEQWERS